MLSKGLSTSSKQTLDDIQLRQPTQGIEIDTVNQEDSDWVDVDDRGPMDDDDEVEVSGEGEEIHILLERSGA